MSTPLKASSTPVKKTPIKSSPIKSTPIKSTPLKINDNKNISTPKKNFASPQLGQTPSKGENDKEATITSPFKVSVEKFYPPVDFSFYKIEKLSEIFERKLKPRTGEENLAKTNENDISREEQAKNLKNKEKDDFFSSNADFPEDSDSDEDDDEDEEAAAERRRKKKQLAQQEKPKIYSGNSLKLSNNSIKIPIGIPDLIQKLFMHQNLNMLDLSFNAITSLSFLEEIKNTSLSKSLKILYLHANNITSIEEISKLAILKAPNSVLNKITIHSNPITDQEENLKFYILGLFDNQQINSIDFSAVTKKDKENAIVYFKINNSKVKKWQSDILSHNPAKKAALSSSP